MILLKITNSSEVIASRLGKFLESLTPDSYDLNTVESMIVQELVQNLSSEGIKGEVATVKGMDMKGNELIFQDSLKVRHRQDF
jgi:hypothetical protein